MRHNVPVRTKFTSILLLALLALASCNRGHNPARQKQELTAVEYEVLSAWLNSKITPEARKNGVTQVVIYDTTDSDDDHLLRSDNGQPISWEKEAELLRTKASFLQQSTLDAYRKVNAQPRSFVPPCIHRLIINSQIQHS